MYFSLFFLLVGHSFALESWKIYEQVRAAKHVHGFFDANPLVPPMGRSPSHRPSAPPPPTAAVFSTVFSDFAVLQRQPYHAAVYGLAVSGASVTVTVDPPLDGEDGKKSNKFTATVFEDGSWKTLLPPTRAGGDYTVSVACTAGCASSNSSTLNHVTFGDIWV